MSKGKNYAKKIAFEAIFKDKTGGLAKLQSFFQNIHKATEKTSQSLDKVQKRLSSLNFNGLRTFQKRSEQVAKKVASMSDSFMLPSLAGTATSIFAMASPAHLEREIYKLAELGRSFDKFGNKVRLTSTDLAELVTEIRRIGAETQFSNPEAAMAMNRAASQGWNDRDTLMAATAPITYFTGASRLKSPGFQLEGSAEMLTSLINAFHLPKSSIGDVADKLAYAISNSGQTSEELNDALIKVGSLAKDMNLPFEDAIAITMQLADIGVKDAIAGTALSGFMSRMSSLPPEGLEVAHARFSPSERRDVIDETGKFKAGGLQRLFQLMGEKHLTVGEKMKIMGVESGRSLIGLTGVMKGLKDVVEALKEKSHGLAKVLNDVQVQGLLGQLDLLGSAIDETATKIGFDGGVLGSVTSVITRIKEAVEGLNQHLTPETAANLGAFLKDLGIFCATMLGLKLAYVSVVFIGLSSKIGLLVAAGLVFSKFVYDNFENLKTIFQPIIDFISGLYNFVFRGEIPGISEWLAQSIFDHQPTLGPDEEFGAKSVRYWNKWFDSLGSLNNWNIPFFGIGEQASESALEKDFFTEMQCKEPKDIYSFFKSLNQESKKESKVKVELSFKDLPRSTKFKVENPDRIRLETYTGWAMEGIG
mgnify:CR=1 FL=1